MTDRANPAKPSTRQELEELIFAADQAAVSAWESSFVTDLHQRLIRVSAPAMPVFSVRQIAKLHEIIHGRD